MGRANFYGGMVSADRAASKSPASPGASESPQRPGQTPDRTDIHGQVVLTSPPLAGPARRPLSENGTAQEIMNMLPAPTEEAASTDFEQAPPAYQEQRKAYPWQLPPVRPASVFALDQGIAPEPPALPAGEAAALAEASAIEG